MNILKIILGFIGLRLTAGTVVPLATCFVDCGSDPPDTSGLNAAAVTSANISKEALDWYKQAYADQAPARAAAEARANKVSDAQLAATRTATAQAQDYDTYNKTTFRPLEKKLVADSTEYDTPQRRMAAAAAAAAGVDQSFAATNAATERELARSGMAGAPDSGKARALMQDAAIAQAAARAGAATTAERNVETTGHALQMDAASLGRGLPSAQATQQQIATTTGNSSVGNSQNALTAATSGNATMGQGFQTGLQGQQIAGNLYAQSAGIQQKANDGLMDGLVGLGGLGVKLWQSDKGIKKNTGRMADTAKKLREVEKTPIHEGWQYDPAKGGPDDGGQPHDGPMAQDVNAVSGEQAAPGGKVINLPDRMARMEAAIQELSKRQKAMAKHKEAA